MSLISSYSTFTAGGALATSTPVSFVSARFGRILNNSGAAVTLTVYEAEKADGTYTLCDDVGTAGVLSAIADGESLRLPEALEGCAWLKFVAADTALPSLTFVKKG